jgi:hypothetical protein
MVDSSDQRNFHRMTVECEIKYRKSGTNEYQSGTANNISAGGLQFTSVDALDIGDQVEVLIEPGVSLTPPLHAMVEVVRTEELADSPGNYRVACNIRQILD